MSCLRTFDCYRNVPLTFHMFKTMFTTWNWNILWDGSLLQIGLDGLDYIILFAGLLILIFVSVKFSGSKLSEFSRYVIL